MLLVLIGVTWAFSIGQVRHHRVAFRIQGMIDGIVFQMITGLAKLRVAHAEGYALSLWAERFSAQRRATLAARRWAAGQSAVNSMFQPLASLALFAYIYFALIEGDVQPSFDPRGLPLVQCRVRTAPRRYDRTDQRGHNGGERHPAVRARRADPCRPSPKLPGAASIRRNWSEKSSSST